VAKRIRILAMVVILLFGALLVQAANVQFRQGKKLATDPKNPRIETARLSLGRGDIVAADGTVLAHSVATPKGVYKFQRQYPLGSLMAQITGFSSPIYGTYGIEASYDSYLLTHKQPAQSVSQLLSPTSSTDSVALTINPDLQRLAQSQLAGRDGAIVGLNPVTGAVQFMFSNPAYDPNPLVAPEATTERLGWLAANTPNRAGFVPLNAMTYQRTFPPGSTFKVVTSTAVYNIRTDLASKSYDYATTIPLPNTNQTLSNYGFESCGGTVATMLPPSCDTGFAELGLDLGAAVLFNQAKGFGYSERPPLDLPGVAVSNFPTPDQLKTRLPFLAYGAIGQGDVTATALQNALVAAGIADAGVVMSPHLMREIRDEQGNLISRFEPRRWKTAASPAAAAQVSQLMQQVVTQGTAAGVGFRPEDKVAAKTGTAQTSLTNKNEQTDDWMIAFAPADRPVIAIAVILPNQALDASGASVAGPVMKCMIQGALAAAQGQPVVNSAATCPG